MFNYLFIYYCINWPWSEIDVYIFCLCFVHQLGQLEVPHWIWFTSWCCNITGIHWRSGQSQVSPSDVQRVHLRAVRAYQDPSDDWYFKTFFDAGEFGFGLSTVSLQPNRDCPPHAKFLDVFVHTADGSPSLLKNAVCVFEQYGDIMWRHTETGIPNEQVIKLNK